MKNKIKYTCLYCGTSEVIPTLSSYELKHKKCAVCAHDKFSTKELVKGDYFGYGEDEKQDSDQVFPWMFD